MKRLHDMPFGAQPTERGGARVRLWAPAASRVVLVRSGEGPDLGSFPMQVQDGGWFELELPRTQVRTDYAFSIDGGVVGVLRRAAAAERRQGAPARGQPCSCAHSASTVCQSWPVVV
mgnify:CR=1 FL=1